MGKNHHKGVYMMTVTAKKWGNSIGVRIPFKLAQKYGVENGTELEIYDTQDGMMLKVSDRPTLDSLLSQCEGENPVEELFSDTVGKEEI
ncbi:AbrB/MazE/SpoVT family DNA-binding domain-containing protein [Gracilibacillus alcaliphilus]|uniref:AbrB/MazE/SpoVT family DNA-binding domain-containing protein n=1 Tax=Gracilibacillus alcaliphilus TaxID=1401441 RepID=UPI00195946F8|nr:AbrB/MazE/SpoVT family DNA-binding domain-containing protein [Gracilibacillus alcaliphilus]MBM7677839.1 antitoxin MazE [Gracilibacillus alcaliphilus]